VLVTGLVDCVVEEYVTVVVCDVVVEDDVVTLVVGPVELD
jgi:hypothetical protein